MTSARSAAATGLPSTQPAFLDPSTFPDLYGMAITGNCMAPEFPDGSLVKVSKVEPYAHGDVVVVWLRPELIRPGAAPALIKRMAMMPPPWVKGFPYRDSPRSEILALVMLQQNDRPDELLRLRCSDIIAIHKAIGTLAKDECHDVRPKPPRRALKARHDAAVRL